MIDPQYQWCFQVDITNACGRACSNCTRLVGHAPTFHMSLEQFTEAMEAAKDFPTDSPPSRASKLKLVGIMGGEPLLHPQFPQLLSVMQEAIPDKGHRGLWTGLNWQRSKHAKLIGEVFDEPLIHNNRHDQRESRHSPVLVAMKDVISDPTERAAVIDQCWLQQMWCGTITPKGHFFCEVAGALDWVFEGPGGLPVEPSCWRRPLAEFREQIDRWCQQCGIPLNLEGRKAREQKDDISPSNLKALEESPRIQAKQFVSFAVEESMQVRQPWVYREAEKMVETEPGNPPRGQPVDVWTYWEGPRLPYIETCLESMERVCAPGAFHLLTPENLRDHLGDLLHPNYEKIENVAMRVGAIRVAILARHGGFWWDADTVGLQDPTSLLKLYPEADVLYAVWDRPPLRILNGYIYMRKGCDDAMEWLERVNHRLESQEEKPVVWTELGEMILTPLLVKSKTAWRVDRDVFLPIDIDSHVTRFFEPGDPEVVVRPRSVCYGLNHSWCVAHKRKQISMTPKQWETSDLLIHRLLHDATVSKDQPEPKPAPSTPVRKIPKRRPVRTAIVTLATGDYWKGARVLFRSLEAHGLPDNVARIVLSNDRVSPSFATRKPLTQDYSWVVTSDGQFSRTAHKFEALTLDFDRIIIVDSDIFCVKNCEFLWSGHMTSLPFYAVRDHAAGQYYPQVIKQIGLEENLIFNAGTMIYNRWVMRDLHEKLMADIRGGACVSYDGGDQGYFNAFFQRTRQEVGYLPSGYNYPPDPYMPVLPKHARYLFHFAGQQQPWDGQPSGNEVFNDYLAMWRTVDQESAP